MSKNRVNQAAQVARLGLRTAVAGVAVLTMAACVETMPLIGGGSKPAAVSGAAGGATAANASSTLERCDQSLGSIGVVEDQNSGWYQTLRSHKLGSTVPVLRMMIQQSNCFVVVEGK